METPAGCTAGCCISSSLRQPAVLRGQCAVTSGRCGWAAVHHSERAAPSARSLEKHDLPGITLELSVRSAQPIEGTGRPRSCGSARAPLILGCLRQIVDAEWHMSGPHAMARSQFGPHDADSARSQSGCGIGLSPTRRQVSSRHPGSRAHGPALGAGTMMGPCSTDGFARWTWSYLRTTRATLRRG